jgi:hypothetical protein
MLFAHRRAVILCISVVRGVTIVGIWLTSSSVYLQSYGLSSKSTYITHPFFTQFSRQTLRAYISIICGRLVASGEGVHHVYQARTCLHAAAVHLLALRCSRWLGCLLHERTYLDRWVLGPRPRRRPRRGPTCIYK